MDIYIYWYTTYFHFIPLVNIRSEIWKYQLYHNYILSVGNQPVTKLRGVQTKEQKNDRPIFASIITIGSSSFLQVIAFLPKWLLTKQHQKSL